MFADNNLFWLGVRRLLLDFINLLEVELRKAGVYDGPTTSEIRAWWKKQKQEAVALPNETIMELENRA
jgi:hypothetical protein